MRLRSALLLVMIFRQFGLVGAQHNPESVFTVINKFEIYRHLGHKFVSGWLAAEVLDILAVLDSAQRAKNISGAVAEIGVHHGRFFIALNLLQDEDEQSVAIDVFGDQDLNIDNSGKGDLAAFRRNMRRWSSLDSVSVHQGDSTRLSANRVRELASGEVRLFSVDGGHTDPIVFSDMNLAEGTLSSGGIVIADDVFNQEWPGVSTGTLRYIEESRRLVPFAIGFNKVFFCDPDYAEYYLNSLWMHFAGRYFITVKMSDFATSDVIVIAKTPRRPRTLLSRSELARNIYHRVRNLRRPSALFLHSY